VKGEEIKKVTKQLNWRMNYEDVFRQAGVNGVTFQPPGKRWCSGCVIGVEAVLTLFCKDNKGTNMDTVEICVGPDVTPKKESKNVLLVGDCSIGANKDVNETAKVKGCPPKATDTLVALLNSTPDKRKAKRTMMVRLLKGVANKLGLYEEDFPLFRRYQSPEFDANHF
jgi:hypothetical protein